MLFAGFLTQLGNPAQKFTITPNPEKCYFVESTKAG